jgi:dipeptidyl-peptidase-4
VPRDISYDDVARRPLPGMAVPEQLAFAPGERVLTYLHSPERSLVRRLFLLDLDDPAGEPVEVPVEGTVASDEQLSLEEMLRRERARDLALGVPSATWAENGDVLMIPLPDGVRVITGLAAGATGATGATAPPARTTTAAGSDDGPAEDPQLSPDGSMLAFVRNGDVHVAPAGGEGPVLRLTMTATDGLSNGLAEYVAQEEMDRPHGLWWSRDGALIAYAEVDERHIPELPIVHQGQVGTGAPPVEHHRYPYAGEENARVRLGVVPVTGGETTWMDTGSEDSYLARVHWLEGGALLAEIESRDQTELRLVRFDPATGEGATVHVETSDVWINLSDDFRELADGAFVWSSERSGFRHLELRAPDGSLVRVLTEGDWMVDSLELVDEESRMAYFTGTLDGPTERHLYGVSLDGGPVRRLTTEPGTHHVSIAGSRGVFADRFSSLSEPPRVSVRSLADGAVLRSIEVGDDPRLDELELSPPEIVTLPGADGAELYGMLFRPEPRPEGGPGPASEQAPEQGQTEQGQAEQGPTEQGQAEQGQDSLPPLVVHVYGGPHFQSVQNCWASTVLMRAQLLRRRGCTVFVLDNRGSARRGLAFEAAIRHDLGNVEVDDQVAGVAYVVGQGLANPRRVAIEGWSYGGYMSLMCLAKAPDVFSAAVAGAPVSSWDGYDTHYTERYMGTPVTNPSGYERSSVMSHAAGISGDLLLVHGLIDENVHFRHTARLLDRLVAERIGYSLLLFPDERHMPRREGDRAYMEEQVVGFLLGALSRS